MSLEQTTKKGEPVFANRKVLIVDDLEKWLKDATNNLVYYGCKKEDVHWAYNVEDGERIYTSERFPIAMIDINFDVDNPKDTQGLILIPKMKKIKPEGIIVAMSSLTDIEPRTIEAGANYFIQKGKGKIFLDNFDKFVDWYKKR